MSGHRSVKPPHPARSRPLPARDAEPVPEQILSRPDGYYWQLDADGPAFGPFETYELAQAACRIGEETLAPLESLPEVEDEIGISAWIDPETGEPAEGQSPPHLSAP